MQPYDIEFRNKYKVRQAIVASSSRCINQVFFFILKEGLYSVDVKLKELLLSERFAAFLCVDLTDTDDRVREDKVSAIDKRKFYYHLN